MKLLPALFFFVKSISQQNHIDESHSIGHSMKVLHHACDIYKESLHQFPEIYNQENVIYTSAILHDMCDKKYMDETEGIKAITDHLNLITTPVENDVITKIIQTMSYSKVKKYGFPELGIYQTAYHIVREADLLSAYDFDRCIIYDMKVNGNSFTDAYDHAEVLFQHRVFKHAEDNLFTTEYANTQYPTLHNQSIQQINTWKKILNKK